MRPAWIEVNTTSLRKNVRRIKNFINDKYTNFMAVVKADGYGHGAAKVVEILCDEGINRFAVAIVEEGLELRDSGFKEPILILGHIPKKDYPKILRHNLTPIIYDYDQAFHLNKLARRMNKIATIHIKIDTGMGRLGFMPGEDSINDIIKISKLSNIYIEGTMSHLATADEANNEYAQIQFNTFVNFNQKLRKKNLHIKFKHIANSAAIINFPNMHLNMVRPGTCLYGLYPSKEMIQNKKIKLDPVMSIKSKLVHIKTISAGDSVSYGRTYIAKKPMVIGIVPMGYVDGVFRQLSNRGEVLIKGNRCPIIGNICMDQFMVDITNVTNVDLNDEVVFLGKQGEEEIRAEEIALKAGTISIELTTGYSKRMPIIYIGY